MGSYQYENKETISTIEVEMESGLIFLCTEEYNKKLDKKYYGETTIGSTPDDLNALIQYLQKELEIMQGYDIDWEFHKKWWADDN